MKEFFTRVCLFTALILTFNSCFSEDEIGVKQFSGRGYSTVMSWVPSYSIKACSTRVQLDFDGVKVADGLTHLALQFWAPNPTDGSIYYIPNGGVKGDDEIVTWFKEWGNRNSVKIMLCIYNNDNDWNWSGMVAPIIKDESLRTALVNNLISEMNRLDLDGIEIDLEGPSVTDAGEQYLFMKFMEELSTAVNAEGKDLTIAAFHSNYHTPGTGQWRKLTPLVDGLTSMGYHEIGIKGSEGMRLDYKSQVDMAGDEYDKLMLGMPASNSWLGNTALEQVEWAVENGVGVGIWDAALEGSAWRSKEIWSLLKIIKDNYIAATSEIETSNPSEK